jgi:hypothetical protein
MNNFSVRQSVLNITVIINTEYVVNTYSDPSTNPDDPTVVDSNAACMVVAYKNSISGSNSHGITLKAQPGDYINWFGLSDSDNFSNEIILYNVAFDTGAELFSTANFIQFDASIVEPSIDYPQSDPVQQQTTLWYVTAVVQNYGRGTYKIQFGLYSPDESGAPTLLGYFQWEPVIKIPRKGLPTDPA